MYEDTRIYGNVPTLVRDVNMHFIFEVVASGIFSWEKKKESLLEACGVSFGRPVGKVEK